MDSEQKGEIKISLDSISYSWGRKRGKAYLFMMGRAYRTGIDCTFRLEVTRHGHRLEFPKAVTQDKSEDLKALALSVKTAILRFLEQSPEVPEAHRRLLCDCVINHHLQKRLTK
jgi:hypothetical protein